MTKLRPTRFHPFAHRQLTCSVLACLGLAFGCSDSSDDSNGSSDGSGANEAGSGGESGGLGGGGTGGTTPAGGAGTGGDAAGAAGETAGGDGGSGGDSGGSGGEGGEGGSGGMSPNGCPAPNASLCWDFEEGAIPNGWTPYRNEFSGELLVDGTKPYRGSFSLHAKDLVGGAVTVPATQGGPKKSMTYALPQDFGPVMWGRAYVFMTPEVPVSHAGFFNGRYQKPAQTETQLETLEWYEVASYQGKFMSIWHTPEPPGFPEWVKLSDTAPVVGDWACVEWQFDGANGNEAGPADPKVWLRGTELTWPTEFTFDNSGTDKPERPAQDKAANFTLIETGIVMYQGLEIPTNWWIDDLAIGPQRIGCN